MNHEIKLLLIAKPAKVFDFCCSNYRNSKLFQKAIKNVITALEIV